MITTHTSLQNEFSACQKMYYNKYTCIMVNQSVNECNAWFLFKINALSQDVVFSLDFAATFFKN